MPGMHREVHVPVEGGYLAVTDVGAGPPLLLLHGSNADRSWADPLIDRLAPSFRCLAPDRRGVSESTAPVGASDPTWATLADDVLAVVRWAGAARPLVAGASWGAKISLAYAAAGYRCGGVVCIDGCAWGDAGTLHEDLYQRLACPVRMVFATESRRQERDWPYTPETVAAFSARHPQLLLSWLPCGHDIGRQMPAELARLIVDFAELVQLS
jgi:hypothetical protein